MFGVPKFALTAENSSWGTRVILSLAGSVLLSAGFAVYLLGAPVLDVDNTGWIWGDLSLMHLAWVQFLAGDEKGWLSTTAFSFPLSLGVALFDPLPIFLLAAQSLVSVADIERQYLGNVCRTVATGTGCARLTL
ncbi:hypothetical protein ACVC7V_16740 [Hydrogenophaga sp. A37]|uniref:hypothetical protein n=1 Tax=Hydrogenophaga sp. A37 TaxID=1945864 RepID=UPI00117B6A48|nr:hypothetical protein [Hydrogenophaga sp. A37]